MTDSNFDNQYQQYFESSGEVEPTPDVEAPPEQQEVEAQDESAHDESFEEAASKEPDADLEAEAEPMQAEHEENDKEQEISNNLKAALKEERIKRQELEKQFKTQQSESEQIKQALKELLNPPQQAEQADVPSYDDDPVGYLKWQQEQIYQNQQQQQQYLQQQQQTQQAYQQAVNLNNEYLQQKQNYTQQNPDFDNAAKFLEQSVLNEYKALGYDDNQAAQYLVQDKLSVLQTAKERGVTAPELIEQIAQARGYRPMQTQNTKQADSKLNNVKKGMEKAKSLGDTGGDAGNKQLSLDELSRMNDKEFNKVFSQYAKGNLQAY